MEEGSTLKTPNRFQRFLANHRKLILVIAPIVLLIAVSAIIWLVAAGKSEKKPVATAPTPPPIATTVENLLTGIVMEKGAAEQPMAAIIIENLYPNARPQSGMSEAGAVYEAIAEGGITRFLAIFQKPFPSIVGPIRSVRPYFVDWATEYNLPIVHAGGSQDGLARIRLSNAKDVEGLVQSSGFYRSPDRSAPHNLFTKNDLLSNLLAKLKFDAVPAFTPLARKADTPEAPASHPKININFSTARYAVQYDYDAASNSYKRSQGGAAQIDRNTNAQISVKNVIVEFAPTSYSTQSNGKPETNINLVGSGKALFFIDGGYKEGRWSKGSDKGQTTFTDLDGKPIQFNRGNAWYSIVPVGSSVTF